MSRESNLVCLACGETNPDADWFGDRKCPGCGDEDTLAEEPITINIEPSWNTVAEIALALLRDGTPQGVEEGAKLVRDMGRKLAVLRDRQRQGDTRASQEVA